MIKSEKKIVHSVMIYRFIAMLLVMYGHLVSVPTFSYEIPNVISGTLAKTILTTKYSYHNRYDIAEITYKFRNFGRSNVFYCIRLFSRHDDESLYEN